MPPSRPSVRTAYFSALEVFVAKALRVIVVSSSIGRVRKARVDIIYEKRDRGRFNEAF
jgi:hypothetical protein